MAGLRNIEASLRRTLDKYWNKVSETLAEKAPELINGEYLQSTNAANSALINLIRANTSDVPELPAQVALPLGFLLTNIARVPTATGATTGTIAAAGSSLQVITIVAADANDIIILPAPVVGTIIVLINGTTGYELRTTSPTTIGINGGTGSAAESAIPASTTAVLICETATNWKGFQMSSTAGTLAKVEVAAP